MKYLNNIASGASNTGNGFHQSDNIKGRMFAAAMALKRNGIRALWQKSFGQVEEAWDVPPNVLAAEVNECGTFAGDAKVNIVGGMTAKEEALAKDNMRLPTGELHDCPCARSGRAHIINGTTEDVLNWAAVEDSWGQDYTERLKNDTESIFKMVENMFSKTEMANFEPMNIFGLHSIYCPFHASGPCKLSDVERGVASAWAGNFSKGYVPLMDNNAMYWTASIGPLLDALVRDGIDFYPMVWETPVSGSTPRQDVFSVIISPCDKQLVEVAALDNGGRPRDLFHESSIARAVFEHWNEPKDFVSQPLVPLRISRAVPPARLDSMLDFYGVGKRPSEAAALGFGQAKILADVTDDGGNRAVTIMLSPAATVHMQLWARPEVEPQDGPAFPTRADFEAASPSNQINGGQPAGAQSFCASGTWSVARYTDYLLAVHETVMSPVPEASVSSLTPPVGAIMDVFLDDHVSWDCSSPSCDLVAGGKALYSFGSRVQWVHVGNIGGNWTPYSYDPAGYGIQLHWYYASKGFAPEGPIYPECFAAYDSNATCPRAFKNEPVDFVV